ncbi:type II toxin-antitoxin system prevent-host-death family antitoxin [Adlercreutzia sp. R21]|uniref:type II toxin-antitoxin system prevent-host-death family antitoxin n=1 Tax=Adlercreutzia wanghongyangiae TaxID=3111451 RepID=UPI002DBD4B3C|nr:type II toxin-antitoxin system prevent-host-death family antitoxin [Adlercreutzia sp. R21]MEC4184018.1 type II toxin-antitoxin system prevent-host-death family antitoxin [Adlercreutzia sp. R21]
MSAAVPLIRPISDLRTDLNDVCAQAQESRQPIFMTKNGKASLVVIDCAAYEEQRQHERYVHKLREAEIEEKYRKETLSQASLDEAMERIFEVWGI